MEKIDGTRVKCGRFYLECLDLPNNHRKVIAIYPEFDTNVQRHFLLKDAITVRQEFNRQRNYVTIMPPVLPYYRLEDIDNLRDMLAIAKKVATFFEREYANYEDDSCHKDLTSDRLIQGIKE